MHAEFVYVLNPPKDGVCQQRCRTNMVPNNLVLIIQGQIKKYFKKIIKKLSIFEILLNSVHAKSSIRMQNLP